MKIYLIIKNIRWMYTDNQNKILQILEMLLSRKSGIRSVRTHLVMGK